VVRLSSKKFRYEACFQVSFLHNDSLAGVVTTIIEADSYVEANTIANGADVDEDSKNLVLDSGRIKLNLAEFGIGKPTSNLAYWATPSHVGRAVWLEPDLAEFMNELAVRVGSPVAWPYCKNRIVEPKSTVA